ncbi:MAG: DUF1501 domain-containing protein [Deltaproteobacteria bacterium]|nr:DUF1501 domain-containing protein [Deltaproteobacteria bacterium]
MQRTTNVPRRLVLKGGAIAALGFGVGPRFLLRTAAAATAARRRVLVAIFQRGAVDGLNMVVPHGERAYYAARPTIAIPRPGSGDGAAIDLDGFFGLHPAMASLAPAFAAGDLAIVHACGSPDPTRSHFDAQDYMEIGEPGERNASDGWLNRHLQTAGSGANATPVRAVALSSQMPRTLAGPAPALATTSLAEVAFGPPGQGALARRAVERMYGSRDDLLGRATRDALESLDVFASLDATPYQPANGARYPDSELGGQLRDVARAIKGRVGLEIAFLNRGGWDTHTLEGGSTGQLATLLRDLADALAAFRTDLGDAMADVCVLTMSEFGRTLAENGSGGTDHGRGTAMLALGGTVRGGRVLGAWPGLAAAQLADGRDLAVATDFRTLFAEILVRHLGNPDVATVLPGFAWSDAARLGAII